jgi:hypothetical protein
VRSARAKVLAALATLFLVAASAGTGCAGGGGGPAQLPWTKFSLALARLQPCWHGRLRLAVAPGAAHVGEVLDLDAKGPLANGLVGGVSTIFESPSPHGWSAYDYLWTAQGGPDQDGLGSARAQPGVLMILPALADPVYLRVPDVPPGTYRLVRNYSGFAAPRLPRGGANLCAGLVVLRTASAFVPTGTPTVRVSPPSGLSAGQEVRVTLSGFGRSSLVHLSECAFGRPATSNGCPSRAGGGEAVRMGGTGSATIRLRVRAVAQAGPGTRSTRYPCTSNCVLVATLGHGYASAGAGLSFGVPGASGTLEEVGGPPPGLRLGVPGKVSFVRVGAGRKQVLKARTAPDGEFSITVPPGRYQVSGTSPLINSDGRPMTCFADPQLVTISQNVPAPEVDVFCNIR